ncbi:MAG: serine/threonine protein kinase [Microscillaceae bacterium]|nr:serine/threonine protein kinase [Microscillaceae bacterium]
MIGERVLNYKVESRLGEGGIGAVYLATHTQLGRPVAIKVLHPELSSNPEIRERFRQEATTLSALQHINIITLYDYLEEERGLFLILEYAPGQSLDTFITQVSGPIPEEKTLYFFGQMLDGLAYAHQKGVVHRDIKPSNFIVTPQSEIKILDFGIAKILKEGQAKFTKTGTQLGTVLYMSPEQVQGKTVDKRTDIYSLGITLFEMLTGRCPYDGNALTEFQVYEKILNEPLPRMQDFYPRIGTHLQALVDKATAKRPEDRFQSCEEFKSALLSLKGVSPSMPQVAQTLFPTATTPPAPPTKPTPAKAKTGSEAERRRHRNNLVLYSMLSVLLLFSVWFIVQELDLLGPGKGEGAGNDASVGKVRDENLQVDDFEEEYTDEEDAEKSKTPEDILMDSLEAEKSRIEAFIKLLRKDRESVLLKDLLVDGQFESDDFGEFVIQVTVANRRTDARFEEIVVDIRYFDDSDKELKAREQALEPLDPEKSLTFRVREDVEANKFTVKLQKAKVIDLEPSATLDSLNTELGLVKERLEKLEREIIETEE